MGNVRDGVGDRVGDRVGDGDGVTGQEVMHALESFDPPSTLLVLASQNLTPELSSMELHESPPPPLFSGQCT